jgi:indole-3-glycerol phosphate synthase/phosphoribosylanthranilate isomerase
MNILAQIVESKKREIERLYKQYDFQTLKAEVLSRQSDGQSSPLFYQHLLQARAASEPFFITEFKRKSPSEGWINREADLPCQIQHYTQAGAGAISVLTDEPFFGGTYEDLKLARYTVDGTRGTVHGTRYSVHRPLILQKDFIQDSIQVYLAKNFGADLILLIAAILEPEQLDFLRKTAESLGLGVLVEVHDAEELEKIQHLDFKVLGVNNRDLKTFRTSLNRVNTLKDKAGDRFLIAESGVLDFRHFQMVSKADGFLIGTGLMRNQPSGLDLASLFQTKGRMLFKACGIRTPDTLKPLLNDGPDFLGINFSPKSKRRADAETCAVLNSAPMARAVAVFYKNSESEIRETLEKYPFKTVQFYAGDVSPEFVRSLKVRVILAVKVIRSDSLTWSETITSMVEPYAADVDCFILDGANPGSGERIDAGIPIDFPYPFLLAGGLQEGNLKVILEHKNCIGVDIASGIETDGEVDLAKIDRISALIASIKS